MTQSNGEGRHIQQSLRRRRSYLKLTCYMFIPLRDVQRSCAAKQGTPTDASEDDDLPNKLGDLNCTQPFSRVITYEIAGQ